MCVTCLMWLGGLNVPACARCVCVRFRKTTDALHNCLHSTSMSSSSAQVHFQQLVAFYP